MYMMIIAIAAAILYAAITGFFFSGSMIRPIKDLTGIIEDTAKLNFVKSAKGEKLVRMKDETGAMARAVQQMRSKLREMVALIDQAGIKMGDNVTDLTVNMLEVNDICNNNTATTEELAAAIEEAASATDTVNQTIATVKENAESVLAQLGIPMATAIDMYLKQISLVGGIPFSIVLPKAANSVNADMMSVTQIHQKLEKGYADIEKGNVEDAASAFVAFRERH